jgi:hypothetical protein
MSANRHLWVLRSLALASAVFSQAVWAQSDLVPLFVDDPRPLEAAALSLMERYPVTITYEDPRYEYSSDIRDVTAAVRKTPGDPVFVPVGGVLQASYTVARDTGAPTNVADAVRAIVAAKNASDIGGRFEVYETADAVHIVPAAIRDRQGQWVAQRSILDTRITFATKALDGIQLIEAILQEVSKASGAEILGLSAQPYLNDLVSYIGAAEAKDEPARDVLLRVIRSISPRYSWLLNNDPSRHYYIFALVHSVEPPKGDSAPFAPPPKPGDPSPTGGRFQRPAEEP